MATGTLALLALAPTANAYPVGPWGVEGPCRGLTPAECPYIPEPDGLVWNSYINGEKTGSLYVDQTNHIVCSESRGALQPASSVRR
ncbi:hypothetical protein GCM10027089_01540 [Nocardia thraciensis]